MRHGRMCSTIHAMASRPSQLLMMACIGTVVVSGAWLWWLGRRLLPTSSVPHSAARLDVIEAATLYSQRKHEFLNRKFDRVQARVHAVLSCVRQACPPGTYEMRVQEAERAIDELDEAAEHFVQAYRGILAEEATAGSVERAP